MQWPCGGEDKPKAPSTVIRCKWENRRKGQRKQATISTCAETTPSCTGAPPASSPSQCRFRTRAAQSAKENERKNQANWCNRHLLPSCVVSLCVWAMDKSAGPSAGRRAVILAAWALLQLSCSVMVARAAAAEPLLVAAEEVAANLVKVPAAGTPMPLGPCGSRRFYWSESCGAIGTAVSRHCSHGGRLVNPTSCVRTNNPTFRRTLE